MRASVQRASVWAFAAFYGCVSLLGPGWHCVFGHHYHDAPACCHAHASACSHGHSHAARPAPAPQEKSGPESNSRPYAEDDSLQVTAVPTAPHHCPLCQFFGDSQWNVIGPPAALILAAAEFYEATPPAHWPGEFGLYLSRGPPRGLGCA